MKSRIEIVHSNIELRCSTPELKTPHHPFVDKVEKKLAGAAVRDLTTVSVRIATERITLQNCSQRLPDDSLFLVTLKNKESNKGSNEGRNPTASLCTQGEAAAEDHSLELSLS
jgi:hypothetical protein